MFRIASARYSAKDESDITAWIAWCLDPFPASPFSDKPKVTLLAYGNSRQEAVENLKVTLKTSLQEAMTEHSLDVGSITVSSSSQERWVVLDPENGPVFFDSPEAAANKAQRIFSVYMEDERWHEYAAQVAWGKFTVCGEAHTSPTGEISWKDSSCD